MDLNEQIETVKLHVRALVDRLHGVENADRRELAQLGALMLWCDRLAGRCEDIGGARK